MNKSALRAAKTLLPGFRVTSADHSLLPNAVSQLVALLSWYWTIRSPYRSAAVPEMVNVGLVTVAGGVLMATVGRGRLNWATELVTEPLALLTITL